MSTPMDDNEASAAPAPPLPSVGSSGGGKHLASEDDDPTHSQICRNAVRILHDADDCAPAGGTTTATATATTLQSDGRGVSLRHVHATSSKYREHWTASVNDLMGQVRARCQLQQEKEKGGVGLAGAEDGTEEDIDDEDGGLSSNASSPDRGQKLQSVAEMGVLDEEETDGNYDDGGVEGDDSLSPGRDEKSPALVETGGPSVDETNEDDVAEEGNNLSTLHDEKSPAVAEKDSRAVDEANEDDVTADGSALSSGRDEKSPVIVETGSSAEDETNKGDSGVVDDDDGNALSSGRDDKSGAEVKADGPSSEGTATNDKDGSSASPGCDEAKSQEAAAATKTDSPPEEEEKAKNKDDSAGRGDKSQEEASAAETGGRVAEEDKPNGNKDDDNTGVTYTKKEDDKKGVYHFTVSPGTIEENDSEWGSGHHRKAVKNKLKGLVTNTKKAMVDVHDMMDPMKATEELLKSPPKTTPATTKKKGWF